jgi:L-rhamnose mutarotase
LEAVNETMEREWTAAGEVDSDNMELRGFSRGRCNTALAAPQGETRMPRVAFRLRIKAGKEVEYDQSHLHVWPALLAKLKAVGISDYSIFRRDQDLFLVMRVDDFEAAWRELDQDPTNIRWQQEMSKLFEPAPALGPGERFAMMQEVFRLD